MNLLHALSDQNKTAIVVRAIEKGKECFSVVLAR